MFHARPERGPKQPRQGNSFFLQTISLITCTSSKILSTSLNTHPTFWWDGISPAISINKNVRAIWDPCETNEFSELRHLHLPICRKSLNPFTWDIWFPLINNNLLIFRLPALCYQTSIWPSPSLSSLEQFSQDYLRCCLLGLSPKSSHRKSCMYCFSVNSSLQSDSLHGISWTGAPSPHHTVLPNDPVPAIVNAAWLSEV